MKKLRNDVYNLFVNTHVRIKIYREFYHGPMLILDTDYGFYKLFLNSNITSFIGYMDNTMIKLPIYFNSHMRIDEQIINIIPKFFHVLFDPER
jgi:hypothetical protein